MKDIEQIREELIKTVEKMNTDQLKELLPIVLKAAEWEKTRPGEEFDFRGFAEECGIAPELVEKVEQEMAEES